MQISFEGKDAVLQEDLIRIDGGLIPIKLLGHKLDPTSAVADKFTIELDRVKWLETDSALHASVLYSIMQEHITDYLYSALRTGG